MSLKNDLLLRAAKGEEQERVPVWVMRQAGRILKEYRAVRKTAGSFINLATNPELAAEVTLQPVDILGVDAAIIFSDILVVPEAMDLPYEMVEKVGPIFRKTIKSKADVDVLNTSDIEDRLSYVLEAMKLVKTGLSDRVPLIGFAGAPFTIFCYMIEGKGSKTFSEAKKMLYTEPELSHQLLQKITDVTITYLKAQVACGANLVQVFDSWAGILSPSQYSVFATPYISQICKAINNVPVTVFAKGAYFAREEIGQLDCNVVGMDWNMDILESRELIPNKTLQGNLDPCVLYGSFKEIEKETTIMLNKFGKQKYIANLGHGVYPDMNPDNVKCFIDTVKAW
ncbi:uroporphyrinogen decarboxylase [Arcticibacterium luteifluviistationis]|uniref:Uroporphyrinogen decarboxylase n=1 Tax=Arcticibacterium luteifluviistationis TaxID=1784714 RepID=A0A2Z4GDT9_9BACT|nr:uroporphyrinogen decarboxylase [Arcticibacterium luteifluviistationis]AWV99311.1 uroporphyrinogen decarboxylase [Arcticibacterium luteifluviistationis]